MSLRGALALVLRDLGALFPSDGGRSGARFWFLLLAALVLQAGFWYLATPGPQLVNFAPRGLSTALGGIGWTVAMLLLLPALLWRLTGGRLAELGLQLGDRRFGLAAAAVALLIAAPVLILASSDPSLKANYPWAGEAVGGSLASLALWAALYSCYYLSFEFFFRGFLLRLVAGAWGINQAIWLQAVAATLIHLGKPLAEVLAAAPASLVFAVIAVRSRSVLYPALLHLLIGLTLDLAILARRGLLLP